VRRLRLRALLITAAAGKAAAVLLSAVGPARKVHMHCDCNI
jgi:hypothetical protein